VKVKERMLQIREWERFNGNEHDWDRYEAEVIPIVRSLTPSGLARITRLSTHHWWQVRTGRKRLHPMHWDKLHALAAKRSTKVPPRAQISSIRTCCKGVPPPSKPPQESLRAASWCQPLLTHRPILASAARHPH